MPVKFRRFSQTLSDVEVVLLTVNLYQKYGNILAKFQIAFTTVTVLGIFRYFPDRISDVILISLPVVTLTLGCKV